MAELDFDNLQDVLRGLQEVQDSENDMREKAREAQHFITKRNGQWDAYAWDKMDGRFRGTFDMCTPIVNSISGEIEQSDFTIRVSPAGGEASEAEADIYDGLIRNIRNISNAEFKFQKAGRSNVICGFDAFEIVQDWADAESFDQDLFIRRIPNAIDNVWFDGDSVEQDGSDAKWAVEITAMSKRKYKEDFPEGSGKSVGDGRQSEAYDQKMPMINVGRIVYKKPITIKLVMMSDGSVYDSESENYKKVKDDLLDQGITEERFRDRKTHKVYSRLFDGAEWLGEAEETPFDRIPIVPVYGNFDIIENKRVYFGALEKLYDEQRSLNYAISRDIEDGALSPSPTVWMTEEMGEGHDYSRMNIDRAGVRFFNLEPQNPSLTPQYTGGPQVSTGLQATVQNMMQMINTTANVFNAQQGNANPTQSGIAGLQQIEQGNLGANKWFKDLEVAICQIGRVLVGAIPKVYDSTRQVRLLGEDGTAQMVTLMDEVLDAETGENVSLNDLSKGIYDVVCEVGPAFNNQQKETVNAFIEMANVDPSMVTTGKDILLKNLKKPGMDQMAERARIELLNAGLIPESQWTEEEREQIAAAQAQAAQQPPQEDPMMVAARAEEGKAQADMLEAQNKQAQIQGEFAIKQQEQQIKMMELQLRQQEFERSGNAKFNETLIKADQEQQKIDLNVRNSEFAQVMDMQKAMVETLSKQAQTLETLRNAMGVTTVIGPDNTQAYENQAKIVQDSQDDVE